MNIPVRKRFYPLWWLLLSISSLPLPVLYRLADILYGILYYVIRYRKKVVYENLQNAFPEKSETEREAVAKQFYRHLTDIIVETLKLRHLLQHKKEPRLFCMLSDQTPPKSEIQYWTTFMNQPAGFFVGGEKLAALFKMPVYFIQARRVERGRYDFKFVPIRPSAQAQQTAFPVTEEFARMLEAWIHENPADYLWSHRRWKHTRPQSMVDSPQL